MSLLGLLLLILVVFLLWPLIKAYALLILVVAAVVYLISKSNSRL